MIGTLTITGDVRQLAEVAEFAASLSNVSMTTELPEFGGWSVESMTVLVRRLAPKQKLLMQRLAESGGYVDGDQLRELFGEDLRGLTGPISKHIKSLVAEGLLTPGYEQLLEAERDPHDRVNQRTSGIRMSSGLLPITRIALESA